MKSSLSVARLGAIITHFFKRFHLVIFTLTIVIGVSFAVFMLNSLIEKSNQTETEPVSMQTFDQETIDRINSFSTSSDMGDSFSLPSGRINPFVE